jgi:hypothetical protein
MQRERRQEWLVFTAAAITSAMDEGVFMFLVSGILSYS